MHGTSVLWPSPRRRPPDRQRVTTLQPTQRRLREARVSKVAELALQSLQGIGARLDPTEQLLALRDSVQRGRGKISLPARHGSENAPEFLRSQLQRESAKTVRRAEQSSLQRVRVVRGPTDQEPVDLPSPRLVVSAGDGPQQFRERTRRGSLLRGARRHRRVNREKNRERGLHGWILSSIRGNGMHCRR